jgi:hypothetical protein
MKAFFKNELNLLWGFSKTAGFAQDTVRLIVWKMKLACVRPGGRQWSRVIVPILVRKILWLAVEVPGRSS